MTLRTLNYGNYGIFLIMGHAGFCPSTVGPSSQHVRGLHRWAALERPAVVVDLGKGWQGHYGHGLGRKGQDV